jgi:hypothetical protein
MPNAASDEERLVDLLADCIDDPGLFHEAILGRPPLHERQEAISRSVLENRITVVPAAHAVGKSWYAATAALHWLNTRRGSKVITTSASNTQLVNVLWAAIKGAYRRSLFRLPGEASLGSGIPQKIQVEPEWFAIGFSAERPESFSGFHGDNILVIVDESSGVEQPIWDAIEGLGYTSLLALGNPLRSTGHFRTLYDMATAGAKGYAGFHLDAFSSPYAKLTDDDVRERGLPVGLCTRTWIDGVRAIYGEQSLYWRTRVLALFPDEDHDQLIPPAWVDRALAAVRSKANPRERWLSVDLSKGTGRDRTVIMVGDDLGLLHLTCANTISLPEAANLVARLSREWGVRQERIVYDAGGWAGSDFGRYLEALGIVEAVGYFGGHPGGSRYKNRRTRGAWTLRQRLDPDRERMLPPPPRAPMAPDAYPEIARARSASTPEHSRVQPAFCIPSHVIGAHGADLREELLAIRYTHDAKLELEKKDDLVARLGRSPDLADTLIMAASLWVGDV